MKTITKKALSILLAFAMVFTLLSGVSFITAQAQSDISSDFTDPKFLAEVYTAIGKAPGFPIYSEDFIGIDSLNVSWKSISSMAGIEHFVDLEYLNCGINPISSLDVSALSSLVTLHCWDTSTLESLNVAGLSALEELRVSGNKIQTLDLSGCASLRVLDVGGNLFTTLDVADLPVLEYFICYYNPQLTSVNVAGMASLKALACQNSGLTSLDLSGLTSLENLDCYENQLTSLDLSDLTALKTLACYNNQLTQLELSGSTVLESVYCRGNLLTSLDLSGLTLLEILVCDENMITSLDLTDCVLLNDLLCNRNQLTSLDLSGLTMLERLECTENPLTSLSGLPNSLKELNCHGGLLTSLDVSGLAQLTYLSCSANQLLSLNVSDCTSLQTLYCYQNRLTELDITGLTQLGIIQCLYNYMEDATKVTGFMGTWGSQPYDSFSFFPQHTSGFIAATGIFDLPAKGVVGVPLLLSGTVYPSDATHNIITSWEIQNDNGTGAMLSGNNLTVASAGRVELYAIVADGPAVGDDLYYYFSVIFTQGELQTVNFSGGVTGTTVYKTYGDSVFTYSASSNGPGAISYSSSDTSIATVNSDGSVTILKPGTVKITATAASAIGWMAGSASYTIEISPKQLTVAAGSYSVTKEFDGTTSAGAGSGSLAVSGILSADTGVTVSATPQAYSDSNAGSYSVTANLTLSSNPDGKYALSNSTVSVPGSITKKPLTDSMIGALANQPYTANPITPSLTVADGGIITPFEYNVRYADNIAIGTATATITATAEGNYSGTASTTFQIVKGAAPIATVPSNIMVKANTAGSFDLDSIALDKPGAGTRGYTLGAFTDSSNILTSTPALTGSVLSFSGASGAIVGNTATLAVTITTTNYADCTVTITFEATGQDIITLHGISLANKTFNGVAVYPAGTLSATDDGDSPVDIALITLTYTYSGTPNAGVFTSGVSAPSDAGDYVLTIEGTGTGMVINPLVIPFTIERKTVTVTGVNQTKTIGSIPDAYTATISGEVAGFPLTGRVTTATCPTYAIAIGSYPIIPDPSSDTSGNYVITYVNGMLVIFTGPPSEVPMEPSASITPTEASFDKNGGGDISVTLHLSYGARFGGISNGDYMLVENTDYTISVPDPFFGVPEHERSFTFKTAYLQTLDVGENFIIFHTYPSDLILTVTVYDSGEESENPELSRNPFADVYDTDWFIDNVLYVYENGLMTGTSTDPMLFSPDATLTRAMIVTILYRMEDEPSTAELQGPFDDVENDQWYSDAIKWASANGIVDGYGDGRFGPHDSITRQDLAAILMRYSTYANIALIVTDEWIEFADEAEISEYAMDAIQTFNKLGIINGTGINENGQTVINPRGNATRAQAAAMLHRFLTAIVS